MSARLLLAASLGFALVFNIAWAYGTGWLSTIAAATTTLIVPAGLHLWPQIPADRWFRRIPRDVVMTGVCLAALIVSFQHSVEVLQGAGWTDVTAWSVVGGVELLVALSTMALRRQDPPAATDQADQTGRPAPPRTVGELAERERPAAPAEPSAEPDRRELSPTAEGELVAELAAAMRAGDTAPSSNDLIGAWRIGRGRANRILRQAEDEAHRLRAVPS